LISFDYYENKNDMKLDRSFRSLIMNFSGLGTHYLIFAFDSHWVYLHRCW